MVLNDTSVWIEFFRDETSPITQFIRRRINDDEVVYNGIVMGELLMGTRTKKEYHQIRGALEKLPYIEFEYDAWIKASEIAFNLRRKGKTIPLTDCLIAGQCLLTGYELFTLDNHFDVIAEEYPLSLVKV